MAKCEFCDKGVTFGIKGLSLPPAFQSSLEAQCQAREGSDQRHASPCICLYPVPAFRQSYPRDLS